MKPTQKVDLCNLSGSLISIEPIVSLDTQGSKEERVFNKWYDKTLMQCLSLHPWNFAKKRAILAEESAPAFGYTNQFKLPSDYIRLNFIGNNREDFKNLYSDYSVEGGSILLNYGSTGGLPMQYTSYEERVGLYSPWFIEVFMYKLAINVSPELNRSTTEIELLTQQFNDALSSAKQQEGQESPPLQVVTSTFKRGY